MGGLESSSASWAGGNGGSPGSAASGGDGGGVKTGAEDCATVVVSRRFDVLPRFSVVADAVREVSGRRAGAAAVAAAGVARVRVRPPGTASRDGPGLSSSSITLQSTSTLLPRGWRSCCWAFA